MKSKHSVGGWDLLLAKIFNQRTSVLVEMFSHLAWKG
jgi:hypothetical protein